MTNRSTRLLSDNNNSALISRRRLLRTAVVFSISTPLFSLIGCGGSKHDDTPALPAGNDAFRSVAIAGAQSLASGQAYPLAALRLIAPTGSVFNAASTRKVPISAKGSRQTPTDRVHDDTLQLYKLYSESGNKITVAYSADAAGAVSAGSATVTVEGASSVSTDYASYPVTVTFSANTTGGVLPFSGDGRIVFAGASGANTLTGNFQLARNNIRVSGTLSLDNSNNVGGSLTIVENGATLHLTQVSGNVEDTLTSPITCEPYGWTGTGMFNLATGQFSITLNTGNGNSTATSDASGNLVLNFADGTSQTISSPLTAFLNGSQTSDPSPSPSPTPSPAASPTPTPSPTAATYNAPVSLGAISPTKVNNNNQVLAFRTADGVPVYLSSASASPLVLNGGVSTAPGNIYSPNAYLDMNDGAQIVSYVYGPSSDTPSQTPSNYWSAPSASPQTLMATDQDATAGPIPSGYAINNAGTIVGFQRQGSFLYLAATWNDPAKPVNLPSPTNAPYHEYARGISSNGQIVGETTGHSPLYWHSSSETPQLITLPYRTFFTNISHMGVNDSGQIIAHLEGSSPEEQPQVDNKVIYWSNSTATGQFLKDLENGIDAKAYSINSSGVIAGSANGVACVWKNQQPQNLNDLIPAGSGWKLIEATSINDQGVIVGIGTLTHNGTTQTAGFLLRPL